MNNKTVFITGAAKNTGLAIAERFARDGCNIALSSRDAGAAAKTADELMARYPVKAAGYGLDLKDPMDISRVFAQIKSDFGRLDVFVGNSADLAVDMDLLTVTPEEFDSVTGVNIKGNYFCCQNAAKVMKNNGGGAIVLIGSVHYKQAIWGRSLYSMSKGALASLTRSMAVELGACGIRANCLVAGAIHTERWDSVTDEQNNLRRNNYPAGRESYTEEIAEGVFYLGSDMSKTVTGTDLTIDSGISVCLLPFQGGRH